jgi:hypothetical protein
MEESMQKMLARNVEQHFDQVLCFVDSNHKQFGAVWKFRNVLLGKSSTALRRALYKWHKVACNPIEVIALNAAIPSFYNKRH